MLRQIGLCLVAVGILVTPLAGQGKGRKKYAVTNDRALVVTKDALVKQGYEVVAVGNSGHDVVVGSGRGNRGRGERKGGPGTGDARGAVGARGALTEPSEVQ